LHLGNNAGVDERVEADATKVQQTSIKDAATEAEAIETAELEVGEVEVVEDTSIVELLEILELLEEEDVLNFNIVADVEQVLETTNVQVVIVGEQRQDVKVEAVELGKVVQVDRLEAVEVVELADIERERALLNLLLRGGGRSDQSGEGRNEDGSGLHFDDVRVNDSSQTIKRIRNRESTATEPG